MTLRVADLTTFAQFQQVERLEAEIWGPIDLVPVPIMAVTVKRGAVLIGAYDGDRLAGFVYSFPALRRDGHSANETITTTTTRRHDGTMDLLCRRTPRIGRTCSACTPTIRGAGLGRDLKLAQRERVLALGLDLIEWTYDPLQALNAHLNIVTLGAVIEEYEENVYGESASPLHGGLPTDRFVCQWWIRRPHVERRLRCRVGEVDQVGGSGWWHTRSPRRLSSTRPWSTAAWLDCGRADLTRTEPRIAVDIPVDFTGMLAADLARARRWRFHVREIFTRYFQAGYRVVDFALHREHHRGRYLLTSIRPTE